MLKNYLKVIIRTFLKSKVYTLINITGLTTGMVVFILIMLYVNYEFSVDQYHEKKDRIYRIVQQQKGNMYLGDDRFAVTMAPLAPTIMEEFPEVEYATRIARTWNVLISDEDNTMLESIIHGIDPETFNIFTFEYVQGNPDTWLKDKYTAVISESTARKYFKDDNPIGQTFLFKKEHEFEVVGVIKDMPANSHFRMDIMIPFETLLEVTNSVNNLNHWGNNSYYTYFLLNGNSDSEALESKFPALLDKYTADNQDAGKSSPRLYLQELTRIHLHSDIHFDIAPTVNVNRLYIYSTIALLILLIACINYMNLATARAAIRTKEVGIRKVAGAFRYDLVVQFLGESLLLTFFSLLFSMMIVAILLPYFEQFVELDLSLNLLENPDLIIMLLIVCGFVGIVSGSYPAFALSAFKPITVLKGSFNRSVKGSKLRNILVITQFVISGCLIMTSLIVTQQLAYIQKKDMGYDREHIVTLKLNDWDLVDKMPVFKEELRKVPGVFGVASSSNLPNNISSSNDIKWPGKPEEINWAIYSGRVDFEFIDLYGIEIVEGRNFSRESGDENGAVLINETAAKALGWDNPIGRELSNWRDTCTIIGIMKDFHQHSLHQEIMPLQLFFNDYQWNVSIKISGDNIEQILADIKKTKELFSEKYPFNYAFFDDEFDKAYKSEQKAGKLANWFTIITIIIACLGLYGLAAFTAEQRIKEVGIRKVLGAPVYHLIYMLSKDFTWPVLISFMISAPIAYFSMQKWLSGFAFHININIDTFLATFIIMILVAWFTVSYRTFRVANSNPVNSLRDE
ncbi:ABC transporter permease [Bacteroidota bacterium]